MTSSHDECAADPHPCGTGICINSNGSFACDCADTGFKGVDCSDDVDECSADSFLCNGGACVNSVGGYFCNCDGSGFEGIDCENDADECIDDSACVHGRCFNTAGSYFCDCSDTGFEGTKCENDIDECSADNPPCSATEDCANAMGTFSCRCAAGFEAVEALRDGQLVCEDVDECTATEADSDSCSADATCQNTDGSYTCTCNQGFLGDGFECESPRTATSTPTTTPSATATSSAPMATAEKTTTPTTTPSTTATSSAPMATAEKTPTTTPSTTAKSATMAMATAEKPTTPTSTSVTPDYEGDVCDCMWPPTGACGDACSTPTDEAEAECARMGYADCKAYCLVDMELQCPPKGVFTHVTDQPNSPYGGVGDCVDANGYEASYIYSSGPFTRGECEGLCGNEQECGAYSANVPWFYSNESDAEAEVAGGCKLWGTTNLMLNPPSGFAYEVGNGGMQFNPAESVSAVAADPNDPYYVGCFRKWQTNLQDLAVDAAADDEPIEGNAAIDPGAELELGVPDLAQIDGPDASTSTNNEAANKAATGTWTPLVVMIVIGVLFLVGLLVYICVAYVLPTKCNKKHKKGAKIAPEEIEMPDEPDARADANVVWHDPNIDWQDNAHSEPLPEVPVGIAIASDLEDIKRRIRDKYLSSINAKTDDDLAALTRDASQDGAGALELTDALNEVGVDFDPSGIYAAANAAERRRLLAEARSQLEAKRKLNAKMRNRLASKLKALEKKEADSEAATKALHDELNEVGVDFDPSGIYAAANAAERRRLLAEARSQLEAQHNLDAKLRTRLAAKLKALENREAGKDMLTTLKAAEAAANEAAAALFAAKLFADINDYGDFEPELGGAATLSSEFQKRLHEVGGTALVDALTKKINGNLDDPKALELAMGQTLAQIEREAAKHTLALGREKDSKAALLQATLHNRLARRMKAVNAQHAVILAETAVVAPSALPPTDLDAFGAQMNTPAAEAGALDLEAAFKKAYLEGLRCQLLLDRQRVAQESGTDNALRNRLAKKVKATEKLLEEQLAGNKAAVFAERFLGAQMALNGWVGGISGLEGVSDGSRQPAVEEDADFVSDLRKIQIEQRRAELQLDRQRLQQRSDLDTRLKSRLAAQLDADAAHLDADDMNYGVQLRAAKLDQLRQQLQLQRDLLAARTTLDATLRNRLAARLDASAKMLDADDVHFHDGILVEAKLNAILDLIETDNRTLAAIDGTDSGAAEQKEALERRLAARKESFKEYKVDHATYLKQARAEALRHQLAQDRALLERSQNVDASLANRLAEKLKAGEDMLRSATDEGRSKSAKRSGALVQQLSNRNVDPEKVNVAVSTAYTSTLRSMIADTKKALDASQSSNEADEAPLAKQLAELQALLDRRTSASELEIGLHLEKEYTSMQAADTAVFEQYRQDLKAALASERAAPDSKSIDDLEQLLQEATEGAARQAVLSSYSLPLEMALKAAFDEGMKQRGYIDESETAENGGGGLAMQQMLIAEAKTDLAFVSPAAAIRVARETAAQNQDAAAYRNSTTGVGASLAPLRQPTASSALSETETQAFKQKIKASYLEGLKTEGDDDSEMETRLRKSRVAVLRKRLADDRQQLSTVQSTNLALRNRLLSQIKANEDKEEEENAVIQLEEAKMQIAADKADEFAAQFLEVFDAPYTAIVVDIPHDEVSPVFPVPGSEPKHPRIAAAELAVANHAKQLEHAMTSAMKAAFQQGTRQTLAWNREESHQRQTNQSKVHDRLAARLGAAEKSKAKIAKKEDERKAVAAAQAALTAAAPKEAPAHVQQPTALPAIGGRLNARTAVHRPVKTVSQYERDFKANDLMFQARQKQEKRELALVVKKRKDKAARGKGKSGSPAVEPHHQVSSASMGASHAAQAMAEATEVRALAMAEELESNRQRADNHRKERMNRARQGRTSNSKLPPLRSTAGPGLDSGLNSAESSV